VSLSWGIALLACLACITLAGICLAANAGKHATVTRVGGQLARINTRLNSEIQQRARIEKELASAREDALEASRIKSQFLATISHEIRTPMHGILGLTGLLLDTGLTAEQRDYAESLQCCGEALLGLIDDMLDFTGMEAGKLKLKHIQFDPLALIEDVLDLLRARAQAKNLRLTREFAEDVPKAVTGDPERLRQMLAILIGNAVKFTEQGEVFVSTRAADREESSLTLRVEIHDTGIGISAASAARLFESFSQADGSNSRKYGGAGLGLVMCKRLAQMMGGDVSVQSEPGKGSTFCLTLRLAIPPGEQAPQALYEPERIKSKR
jgi:two-component system sensor histidine kinase/response regulator